jgi:hypothetical protein
VDCAVNAVPQMSPGGSVIGILDIPSPITEGGVTRMGGQTRAAVSQTCSFHSRIANYILMILQ